MKILEISFTFLFVFYGLVHTASAATFRRVALSDDIAPGTTDSAVFTSFSSPALNNNGRTAFLGLLTGATVDSTNDRGFWSEQSGSGLTLIAREGYAAPGTESGVTFRDLAGDSPVLNDNDQTAFRGFITGPGVGSSSESGIWSEGGGDLALVAREGSQAPGTGSGSVRFESSGLPFFNDSGHVAFGTSLTGTGVDSSNDEGFWSEGGGNGLELIVREGDPAPGTESGVNFGDLRRGTLNNNGNIAIVSYLSGTGIDSTNDTGIWKESGGSGLSVVAREGTPAPGTDTGVNFGDLRDGPAFNDNDHIAFEGRLSGAGVDGTNDRGIWSEGGGSGLALVARTGSAAPGTESGVNFFFFNNFVMNNSGHTAFSANLTGTGIDNTNAIGIWSEGGGNGLELVAREGNSAPGTEVGVNFTRFNTPTLNGHGQAAFRANLTGAGVDTSNDLGIWAEDISGDLRLIVRTGDLVDVDDGPGSDLRIVSAISFLGGTGDVEGRGSGFNDIGQIAFHLGFTDGTFGVFVSDLVKVPEPATNLLCAMLGLILLSSKRSRCYY